MSNHNFTLDEQVQIKDLYLHWKIPGEIAEILKLKAMEVHNFIQSKEVEWADEPTFCKTCGVAGDVHKKCDSCERNIHDFNFSIENNKKLCSFCSTTI